MADDTPKPSVFEGGGPMPDWASDDSAVVDSPDAPLDPDAPTNLDEVEVEPTGPTPVEAPAAEETAPSPASEETPVPDSSDATAAEPAVGTAESETPPEVEIDWEKRYGDLFRTRQQEAAQRAQLVADNQRYQAALEQALPMLQQMAQAKREPTPEQLEKAGIDPDLYKQIAPVIEARVSEREQAIRSEMAQTQARDAAISERAAQQSTIASFMQAKGIEKESDLDYKVGTFVERFASRMVDAGLVDQEGVVDLDMADPSFYEIAFEAAQSPAFARELLANPHFIHDDEYVALAREHAALLQGVKPPTTQSQGTPASKTPLPNVTRAGGAGNPQPGSPLSDDPLADAKALVAEQSKSVFG